MQRREEKKRDSYSPCTHDFPPLNSTFLHLIAQYFLGNTDTRSYLVQMGGCGVWAMRGLFIWSLCCWSLSSFLGGSGPVIYLVLVSLLGAQIKDVKPSSLTHPPLVSLYAKISFTGAKIPFIGFQTVSPVSSDNVTRG